MGTEYGLWRLLKTIGTVMGHLSSAIALTAYIPAYSILQKSKHRAFATASSSTTEKTSKKDGTQKSKFLCSVLFAGENIQRFLKLSRL